MNCIDCIITWVDGSDKEWILNKNKYTGNDKTCEDYESERYRDLGILKYLFRGIDLFMPWIRNVYFVTCGQKPEWLNEKCSKLKFINHSDYIPKKYLPTFSSHTIEMNFHRINGLSEQFIYFNDDMFVLKSTKETDFFKDGLPCDAAVFNAIAMKKSDKDFRFLMPINDIEIINKHFDKSKCIRKNWTKYFNLKYGKDIIRTLCLLPWIHFTGFYNYHFPYSLSKETLEILWKEETKVLDSTCKHKFRNSNDVNIWLALYWQYASGKFFPRSPKIGNLTCISDDLFANELLYNHVKNRQTKLIVINDNIKNADIDNIKLRLVDAFDHILPNKSSFEK